VPFHAGFTFHSFKEISWEDGNMSDLRLEVFFTVFFGMVTLHNAVVPNLFMPMDTFDNLRENGRLLT